MGAILFVMVCDVCGCSCMYDICGDRICGCDACYSRSRADTVLLA